MADDMPDSPISPADPVDRLDRALLALRRFFEAPAAVPDGDRRVELSTLLIVDAVATGIPDGDSGGISIGVVARALAVSPSTASRLVDRAVAHRVVVRQSSAASRRHTVLTLTDAGRALHERARAYRTDRLQTLLHGWSPEERETFAELMTRFAAAAGRTPPRPQEPSNR
ncbi:MarR family winged helix-turn-helix transcriptional regulator [Planobispora siamensis]|uniref:HTH marR-type domain-containing protein n=1 Tax=Planobispora siamensis TaxID=936338 RepID=A0A8J3SMJ4_9ACTN|nr:MarR family transcriptional regulator [Planobispora siamensis]GIH95955.1 hypothetical protein Psi01_65850 [Planobispora siamensis]